MGDWFSMQAGCVTRFHLEHLRESVHTPVHIIDRGLLDILIWNTLKIFYINILYFVAGMSVKFSCSYNIISTLSKVQQLHLCVSFLLFLYCTQISPSCWLLIEETLIKIFLLSQYCCGTRSENRDRARHFFPVFSRYIRIIVKNWREKAKK